jgi:hypothetical protein
LRPEVRFICFVLTTGETIVSDFYDLSLVSGFLSGYKVFLTGFSSTFSSTTSAAGSYT